MKILKIKKLRDTAVVPTYAHPGDAGIDLHAAEQAIIKPGQKISIATGIACQLPRGTVGLVWDKSGLSAKHGLKVLGGVIDAGYRGEIVVTLANLGSKMVTIEAGHKIAQMLVQHVHQPRIIVVESLGGSHRGTGGFGSTGK